MKCPVLGTLLVAAVVCFAMLSCSQQPQQAVNAQPAAKAQQWEYKIVEHERLTEDQFNKLGADGWEYAGGPLGSKLEAICFKRPKR